MSTVKGVAGEFHYHRRVQFADTDLAGIVHFSAYFRYMEEAEHALWRAAGLSIARRRDPVRWPRVSASFEFRQPLHFEDEIDVRVRIAALSRRTIRYAFGVMRGNALAGEGTMTIACVRRTAARMIPVDVPAGVVSALGAALAAARVRPER
jgi:acyl-CoA thioester hydrolase